MIAVVRYAAENGIPVHARGAGTGVSEGAWGRGWFSTSAVISGGLLRSSPKVSLCKPGWWSMFRIGNWHRGAGASAPMSWAQSRRRSGGSSASTRRALAP